ncbi:MAG: VacJ family lipoprotein [Methylococcales symbiont of Iophon sp. n. MRB-2018]|nr:MAG: VacJ family lipoprotein [Methylococcales symbiont of Iophon sp. n. MRB-2018]KAF3980207.1 MAG: VacJ family lipoprotein [Methylococcales symbiont of Iophon sp. n. MRB-2018]
MSLLLSGCAGNKAIDGDPSSIEISDSKAIDDPFLVELSESDPYEEINRKIFKFNEGVDKYIANPLSEAYLYITPRFVRTSIANFFNNLKDINVVINDVLQGKLQQGMEDSGRFLLNTTAGFAGIIDVATEVGLERHEEDFAQTLAVWGTPKGPYLVLPLLGPSTSRGIPGSIFDTAANPATYVGAPIQLIQMLNARSNAKGALKFIDEAALDPYVFIRESFLQHRKHLVTDGNSEITDDVMALEDDFYDDDELLDEVDITKTKVDKVMEKQEVEIPTLQPG